MAASVRAQAREELAETLREDSGRPWRIRRALASYARIAAIACAGIALVSIAVAALGTHLLGSGGGESWQGPVSPALFGPQPDAAAASLVQRRLDALATSDAAALVATTDPASPARADDLELAEALRSGDLRLEGFSGTVGASEVLVASDGAATVRVSYAVSAHVEAGTAGRGERPGALVASEVEIRWGPGGWRIDRIQPAP